jgi:hypothetical protein
MPSGGSPGGMGGPPSVGFPKSGGAGTGEAAKGTKGSEAGEAGGEGEASEAGGSGGGSMPDAAGGGGGSGGSGDPEDVFDKSLGDFDGEIARERAGMASAGKGGGRSAQQRESADSGAVKTAGQGIGLPGDEDMEGGGEGESGGMAGGGGAGGMSGESPEGEGGGQASASGEGGAGQTGVAGEGQSGQATGQSEEGKAPDIPADIPADGSGEDQVARQIREAAMAEKDPQVREALWEQYRKHTGLKK